MREQDIIRRPLITEKAAVTSEVQNTVVFEVALGANKIQIRNAVQARFKRQVAEVRIARMHGKVRRQGRFSGQRPDWKKAYVRLAEGEKPIDFFEN